ncbi:hypothetical protein LEP1GSC035_2222 [Leptospira noguchii str. 2007001578]|uniref:Uncharacterized protein n=1 Tax=Leptospira noguchii str. 2007001578 TaxID=1049974 RepID=A0ABP2T8C0_9LEPT|nr:hypothetical protein LEP1GSC035_2222 [Leptospira noguchii str. 2007001578]
MSLFTCKKYVFLIEKSLPNFSTSAPTQKQGWELSFTEDCRNSHTDLILRSKYLWVRLSLPKVVRQVALTQQNAFYESVGNSAKRFPTGRVLGSIN